MSGCVGRSYALAVSFLALFVNSILANSPDSLSEGLSLQGVKPDRFVSSAPLVVAAVCKDGVAVIATHQNAEELLLLQGEDNNTGDEQEKDESSNATPIIPDLPRSYRGPLRIHKIDSMGTTLVCAGWRTDGELLAKQCRALAAAERERFGEPNGDSAEYGRYLAAEASLWMAQCAISDNVRALSCVGLLASCGTGDAPGCLWLVDATGYYRVRAHSLGAGDKVINDRLGKLDFSNTSRESCLEQLITVLSERSDKDDAKFELPPSMLEMAIVDSTQRTMQRIRQPFATKTAAS